MRILSTQYPAIRSPWIGLENEIDRLFEASLAGLSTPATRVPVDLYEDRENAYVRAELPGVAREDVGVEMIDGYLTLEATRRQQGPSGVQTTRLSRSVAIPEEVQADKVSAALENGVLTVTLPKREESRPRRVTVAIK